jgi:hypothetical protein
MPTRLLAMPETFFNKNRGFSPQEIIMVRSSTTARDIAVSNYEMGVDQAQVAEYLVNAIDTAREEGVSASETASAYLALAAESTEKCLDAALAKIQRLQAHADKLEAEALYRDNQSRRYQRAAENARQALEEVERSITAGAPMPEASSGFHAMVRHALALIKEAQAVKTPVSK